MTIAEINTVLAADCRVKIDGSDIDKTLYEDILMVEVHQSLHLPSMFVIKFFDPELELLNNTKFKVGGEVEILMGQTDTAMASLITGEITGLELDFDKEGLPIVTMRGYDRLHRLHRGRITRTFADVTDSDVVSKLVKEAGLRSGVTATSPKYTYIIQNNETNLEFLRRRVNRIGMELYVEDNTLKMREMDKNTECGEIKWREDLLSFNMRLSTIDQVDEVIVRGWDSAKKEAVVGTYKEPDNRPKIGEAKSGKQMAATFGTSKIATISRAVTSQGEAEKVAKGIYTDLSGRFIQTEGSCLGNKAIKPGTWLKISKLGTKPSGKYYLTSCVHRYRQGDYITYFEANGRQSNTLLELTDQSNGGGDQTSKVYGVVVGVVTNNKDPDGKQGRVKVKFPWMPQNEGKDIESNWARIATPMAGKERGFFFLPEVEDEVLVAFEHGDVNLPYIVGYLWNGKDGQVKKSEAVLGSRGKVKERILKTTSGHTVTFDDSDDAPKITIIDKTTKNKLTIDSKTNVITIESDKDIELKALKGKILLDAQNIEMKATQNIKATATQNVTVEATQNIDMKASLNFKVEAKANAEIKATANLTLQGTVAAKMSGGASNFEAMAAGATVSGTPLVKISGPLIKLG